jgi:hypothetical protein
MGPGNDETPSPERNWRVVVFTVPQGLWGSSHRLRLGTLLRVVGARLCRVGRDQSQQRNDAPGVGVYPGVSEKAFACKKFVACAFHRAPWLGGKFTRFAARDVAAGGPMDTRRAPQR